MSVGNPGLLPQIGGSPSRSTMAGRSGSDSAKCRAPVLSEIRVNLLVGTMGGSGDTGILNPVGYVRRMAGLRCDVGIRIILLPTELPTALAISRSVLAG